MLFNVTYRDRGGLKATTLREASSRSELLLTLRAEGKVVLEVTEEKATSQLPPKWHPAWLRPVRSFDIEIGLRQLASMLRSGLALLHALKTVKEQAMSPRAALAWMKVEEAVFQGRTFSSALSEQKRCFGEIVVRLGEVGEKSGELEYAMSKAADQLEARRNLRNQVINALVYPVLAVAMAIGVSAYLVVAVIPKIADFLQSGGAELPAITQMLMDASAWVNANGLTVLTVTLAAVGAWMLIRLNESGHEIEDVLLLRLPIVGNILRLSGTALFARSMQIMIESGVTLVDSLSTGSELMANRRFRHRVANAHDQVVRGVSLADSLAPAVEFLPMLRKMVSVGEVSGSLVEVLGETARFHEMMLAIVIRRFGMIIEPVMICITGGIVGFVYIAFFVALFSIAGAA